MTTTTANTISKMQKVSKKEFNEFFKSDRFLDKKYYYTDEGNKIYSPKCMHNNKDVAAYIFETNEYFIKKDA